MIRQDTKILQDLVPACQSIVLSFFSHLALKCLVLSLSLSINTHRKPTAEFLIPLLRTSEAVQILFCFSFHKSSVLDP